MRALIVVDASVLANVIGDDGDDGQRAREEFPGAGDVAAPDLVDVETVAALRKRWLAGTISIYAPRSGIDPPGGVTFIRLSAAEPGCWGCSRLGD